MERKPGGVRSGAELFAAPRRARSLLRSRRRLSVRVKRTAEEEAREEEATARAAAAETEAAGSEVAGSAVGSAAAG